MRNWTKCFWKVCSRNIQTYPGGFCPTSVCRVGTERHCHNARWHLWQILRHSESCNVIGDYLWLMKKPLILTWVCFWTEIYGLDSRHYFLCLQRIVYAKQKQHVVRKLNLQISGIFWPFLTKKFLIIFFPLRLARLKFSFLLLLGSLVFLTLRVLI